MADFGLEMSSSTVATISSAVSILLTAVAFRIRNGKTPQSNTEQEESKAVIRTDCLMHIEENRKQHEDFYRRLSSIDIGRAGETVVMQHVRESLEEIKQDVKAIRTAQPTPDFRRTRKIGNTDGD